MKRKVAKILYRSKVYNNFDLKVELDCNHIVWLWGSMEDLDIGDEADCFKCSKEDPNKLEILK